MPPPGGSGSETADLAAVARQEVARRTAVVPDGQVQMRVRGPEPVQVALAAPLVSQVLRNLLDNAALHGKPPVVVSVDAVAGAGRSMVLDQGEGMDAELLAVAIRRFTRSPAARSRPGFGLGLSLVDGILRPCGGQLRLCFAGRHQRFGHPCTVPCRHGDEMTVTVLLPPIPTAPTRPVTLGGMT